MLTLLLALGCTGKDSISTDSGPSTDDSDESVEDGVSPEVFDSNVYCYLHDTGDQFYQWSITAYYDDPQGLENVPRSFHWVEIYKGDNLVEDVELLSCDTNSGKCIGSFNADAVGIACAGAADEYDFKIIISDYDGNEGSETVTGKESTPEEEG